MPTSKIQVDKVVLSNRFFVECLPTQYQNIVSEHSEGSTQSNWHLYVYLSIHKKLNLGLQGPLSGILQTIA